MIPLTTLASAALLTLGAQVPPPPASGAPGGLRPAPDALEELLEEAAACNPAIAEAERAAESASARIPQAGALPDPVLGLAFMNVPIADPSLGREMMTMTTVRLDERFPFPGKRTLKTEVAAALARSAERRVESTRARVLEQVKQVYYRIWFLDRALGITQKNEALLGDFTHLTATKYGVGGGAQPDVMKAQVERTRLTERSVALREARTAAVAQLNALLDRPTGTPLQRAELPGPIRSAATARVKGLTFASASLSDLTPGAAHVRPAPGIPTLEELQRLAMAHNPRLSESRQRIEAQKAAVALSRKAVLPDIHVSLGYSRRSGFADFVSLAVSAPLPVFAARKQRQRTREEISTLARREADLSGAANRVMREVSTLVASLSRTRDQLMILGDGILPQARSALSSATASYRVGRVDFLTLIDAQVTLYRHELDYHRLLADFAGNVASLERVVGTEILP